MTKWFANLVTGVLLAASVAGGAIAQSGGLITPAPVPAVPAAAAAAAAAPALPAVDSVDILKQNQAERTRD
ncbi:MAG: hypothetical protein JWQ23_3766, partial [Herminiimonas sp.]|nr:hypothetical protein [Herminiimonas sp.]